MRIGYLIDLNKGGYDQPMPTRRTRTTRGDDDPGGDHRRAGGLPSLQVPHRHGRTESYMPGPEQILTSSRARPRACDRVLHLRRDALPPDEGRRAVRHHRHLSKGRLYTTVSRGFHPGYWMQFGIPQERCSGRFNEPIKIWPRPSRASASTSTASTGRWSRGCWPRSHGRGGWPLWGGGNATPPRSGARPKYGEAWTCDPSPLRKDVWDERTRRTSEYAEELGKKPLSC